MVSSRIRARLSALVLSTACLLFTVASAAAQTRQLPAKLPYPKLDSALAQVVVAVDAGQRPGIAVGRLQNSLGSADTVPVSIRTPDPAAVVVLLRALGARVANEADDVVEAFVTPEVLRRLNSSPAVRRVTQIRASMERAVSQGASVHNACRGGEWGNIRGRGGQRGRIHVLRTVCRSERLARASSSNCGGRIAGPRPIAISTSASSIHPGTSWR